MYLTLKTIHITALLLSVSGVILRSIWVSMKSGLLQKRIVRILPHIVDTVMLVSGIMLVYLLRLPVLETAWLLTKFFLLVIYIVLAAIALRQNRSKNVRYAALAGALITFLYIGGVAMAHSTASWLAYL